MEKTAAAERAYTYGQSINMDDISAFDLQQLTFLYFSLHMFRFHFIQKLPQLVNIENM